MLRKLGTETTKSLIQNVNVKRAVLKKQPVPGETGPFPATGGTGGSLVANHSSNIPWEAL